MSIVKNIELENQIYDIHGKNVQHISWQDYQNLEDKSGDIAYFIEDAPSQKAEGFLSDLPTGSISTVNDAEPLPLNALKVSVEAVQSGSGTPSPSNIRPIIGWDSGEITVCDDVQSPTQTKTYTLDFPQTIYGAEWDVTGGEMDNNDHVFALSDYNFLYNATIKTFFWSITSPLPEAKRVSGSEIANALCECFECVSNDELKNDLTLDACFSIHYEAANSWINIRDLRFTDPTDFRSAMTGLKLKYELANPVPIDLSPLSIRMLQGVNNVYADCGEVIEGEYWAEQSSAQIRMNDEVIAGDATQYAVQSEFAKKADNACTFTVDEQQELLIINWVNPS